LLDQGIAVMPLDWPGTGESASFTSPMADCDDITDGIITTVAGHPDLDPEMVAIGGVSLGGPVAIRCAAYDRRLLGAMAATPPYDPLDWWWFVNPLVRAQLMSLAVGNDSAEDVVAEFGLTDLVPRLRSPVLVFGAGRDMVVPPEESVALAAAAGDLATLVWYPEGGHGLYGEVEDWIGLTGEWLNDLVGREPLATPAVVAAEPEPESRAVRIDPRPDRTPVAEEAVVRSTRVDRSAAEPQTVAVAAEPEDDESWDDDSDLWDE
jgi:pimeloyl-ACP methyl ester carboxylesterase